MPGKPTPKKKPLPPVQRPKLPPLRGLDFFTGSENFLQKDIQQSEKTPLVVQQHNLPSLSDLGLLNGPEPLLHDCGERNPGLYGKDCEPTDYTTGNDVSVPEKPKIPLPFLETVLSSYAYLEDLIEDEPDISSETLEACYNLHDDLKLAAQEIVLLLVEHGLNTKVMRNELTVDKYEGSTSEDDDDQTLCEYSPDTIQGTERTFLTFKERFPPDCPPDMHAAHEAFKALKQEAIRCGLDQEVEGFYECFVKAANESWLLSSGLKNEKGRREVAEAKIETMRPRLASVEAEVERCRAKYDPLVGLLELAVDKDEISSEAELQKCREKDALEGLLRLAVDKKNEITDHMSKPQKQKDSKSSDIRQQLAVNALETKLQGMEVERDVLQSALKSCEADRDAWQAKYRKYEEDDTTRKAPRNTQIRTECKTLKSENEKIKKDMSDIKTKLQRTTKERDYFRREAETLAARIRVLEQERDSFPKEKDEAVTTELEQLRRQVKDLNVHIRAVERERDSAIKEQQSLQLCTEESEKTLDTVKEDFTKRIQVIERERDTALEEQQQLRVRAEKSNEKREAEKKSSAGRLRAIEKDRASALQDRKSLQDRLKKAEDDKLQTAKRLTALSADYADRKCNYEKSIDNLRKELVAKIADIRRLEVSVKMIEETDVLIRAGYSSEKKAWTDTETRLRGEITRLEASANFFERKVEEITSYNFREKQAWTARENRLLQDISMRKNNQYNMTNTLSQAHVTAEKYRNESKFLHETFLTMEDERKKLQMKVAELMDYLDLVDIPLFPSFHHALKNLQTAVYQKWVVSLEWEDGPVKVVGRFWDAEYPYLALRRVRKWRSGAAMKDVGKRVKVEGK